MKILVGVGSVTTIIFYLSTKNILSDKTMVSAENSYQSYTLYQNIKLKKSLYLLDIAKICEKMPRKWLHICCFLQEIGLLLMLKPSVRNHCMEVASRKMNAMMVVKQYGADAYGYCFFFQKPDDACVCRYPF